MIDLRAHALARYRVSVPGIDSADPFAGAFILPVGFRAGKYRTTARLHVVASVGGGWDHLSVSCQHRCPKWDEMAAMHRAFFLPGEVAVQLHVAEADHVDIHPNCLHIWRPLTGAIVMPDSKLI
jgi:hypothetical protein